MAEKEDGQVVDKPPVEDVQSDDKESETSESLDETSKESALLKGIKENPTRTEKELLDLRHENENLRKTREEFETEQETARKKSLEEKEEFKTLYNETSADLAAAKARLAELEAELEGYHKSDGDRLDSLSKDLPDHLREAIDAMTPRQALMWIEAHEDEIRKPRPPNTDAGASGDKLDGKHKLAFEPKVRL